MSWRDELGPAEVAKVAEPVRAWLDGADPAAVGLIDRGDGRTRLWANLAAELPAPRVGALTALGLDAEVDMLAVPGTLTRDQAVAVTRHPDVVGLVPIGGSYLVDLSAPAPDDAEGGGPHA